MKVDQNKIDANQARLNTLNRKQKELIRAKKNELELIRDSYAKQSAYARDKGLEKIEQENVKSNQILETNINNRNKRLEDARTQIIETQKFLENEEFKLRDAFKNKADFIRDSGNQHLLELKEQAVESSERNREDLDQTLGDLKTETEQVIRNSELEARTKQSDTLSKLNVKISNTKMQEEKALNEMRDEMSFQQDRLRKDHQTHLRQIKSDQDKEVSDRQRIHQAKVQTTEQHYDDKMNMELKSFEEKYQFMINEHRNVIDRLNQTFNAEINKLSNAHGKKLQLKQQKSADKFYQHDLIQPTVTEQPKTYTVSLSVPEHEKDQFVLSANKRNIKLSFYRKYFDKLTDEQGLSHSTKRTESLTQNIQVKDIVDANKVTKTYKDNVLSFVIEKA